MQIDEKRVVEESAKKLDRRQANQYIMTERATERLQDLVEQQKKQLIA
jgi:hypothetical protein